MLRNYTPGARHLLPIALLLLLHFTASGNTIFHFDEYISVTSTPAEYTGCPGDQIHITGILVDTDCGVYSVSWSSPQDTALQYLQNETSIDPVITVVNQIVIYTLRVQETCTGNIDQVKITIRPEPQAVAGPDISVCQNTSDTLGVVPAAGVNYQWTPVSGLSDPNIANPVYMATATPGSETQYILTAEQNGCTVRDTIQVKIIPAPQPEFAASISCKGTATTFQNMTPADTSIASWHWNFNDKGATSSQKSPNHTFSKAGTFDVILTATTNEGCQAKFSKLVSVVSLPEIVGISSTNPNDCNSNDGRIIIYANTTHSTQPGLEYSIDGGQTWSFSNIFNGLSPGAYDIKVRNGGTCEVSGNTIQLTEPPSPEIVFVDKINPSDCNSMDGSITVTARGGIGNYRYSIDGANWYPENTFSHLGAGSYPVLVRNADGTCRVSNGLTVLAEPAAPVITFIKQIQPKDCGAADGAVKIYATGGQGSYEFSIDDGVSWHPKDSFPGLPQGEYPVRVRNMNATCPVTGGSAILKDPKAPQFANVLPVNPSDCGAADGEIKVDALSGNGITQYSINNGGSWQPENIFRDLPKGSYDVSIRNADGTCLVNGRSVYLQEPPAPYFDTVTYFDPSDCNVHDGNIVIQAVGGAGIYQYSIDDGVTWQLSNNFQNLPGGIYGIKISNADGTCVKSGTPVAISEPVPPSNIQFQAEDPTVCAGKNGIIQLSATSPSGVEYSIDGGQTWFAEGSFDTLNAGTYDLRVRNADGTCMQHPAEVELTAPNGIIINEIFKKPVSDCGLQDGQLDIQATYQGNADLEYSIDDGVVWHRDSVFNTLSGGNYYVRIRTSDGTCEVQTGKVVLEAPQPVPVVGKIHADISDCDKNDGKIILLYTDDTNFRVSIDGGNTYSEKTIYNNLAAGDYSIKVENTDGTCAQSLGAVTLKAPDRPAVTDTQSTDPGTCAASDGSIVLTTSGQDKLHSSIDGGQSWQQLNEFSGLPQGDYKSMVRNAAKKCSTPGPQIALRADNADLEIIVHEIQPDCGASNGGFSIEVNGTGGKLEYSADGGLSWSASAIIDNLPKGTYNIMVRKAADDCITDAGYFELDEKGKPRYAGYAAGDPSHCLSQDGFIEIQATGNGDALEYSINSGLNWQGSPVFPGLESGNYQIMVRYANGSCAVEGEEAILLAPGAPVVASLDITDATCQAANGQVSVRADTPAGDLEYGLKAEGGTFSWQSDSIVTGLSAGRYSVKVRNISDGCESMGGTFTIDQSGLPTIDEIVATNPDCSIDDGSITIRLNNTLLGITEYSINNGANWVQNSRFENLPEGAYRIKVRNMSDGNWCEADGGIVALSKPNPPVLSVSITNPSNCGTDDGRIRINASGERDMEYSINGYQWSSSNIFDNLTGGTFRARVRYTDESCEIQSSPITLATLEPPAIDNIIVTQPDCHDAGAAIEIAANGNSGTLEYSIDGGQQWLPNPAFQDLAPGDYPVAVRYETDQCEVNGDIIRLRSPAKPVVEDILFEIPDCDESNGQIEIIAALDDASLANVEYSIDDGLTWQSENTFSNLRAGAYAIALRRTDKICEITGIPFRLNAPEAPEIVIVDAMSPTDCNVNNGEIEILATGRNKLPDNGLEYSIDNGTNWQGSPLFKNLAGGSYPVAVRFEDGTCAVQGNTILLSAPAAAERTDLIVTAPDCEQSNGVIEIIATANVQKDIAYSIDNGGTWQLQSRFENLPKGEYNLVYRYADGTCLNVDTTLVLPEKNQPVLADVETVSPTACDASNGSIALIAGGYLPEEYSLNNRDWQHSGTFEGIAEGSYDIWVRYNDGSCASLLSTVELVADTTITISTVDEIHVSDCNASDGQITILATAPGALEYSLNGQQWDAFPVFDNLPEGYYIPMARLTSGSCSRIGDTVHITAPEPLLFESVRTSNITDCGKTDGVINISIQNTNLVQSSIDDGQTWSDGTQFTNLPQGDYTILVRKPDGSCVTEYPGNPVRLMAPVPPAFEVTLRQPDCRRSNGAIAVSDTSDSNPDTLAFEYRINNNDWAAANSFDALPQGSYLIQVRLAGTTCISEQTVVLTEPANCAPCSPVFNTQYLELEEMTLTNPICIPMPLSATLDFDLFLNGNGITPEGGCDADSFYYYGYPQLIILGGSDGPFRLDFWQFNGDEYSGTFPTIDALVAAMNTWDVNGNWSHDAATYSIAGGSTGSQYGNMRLTHVLTNRSVTLMSNHIPVFQGFQLTIETPGTHYLTAYNDADACRDTLEIFIEPRPELQAYDLYYKMNENASLELCDWTSDLPYQPSAISICTPPAYGTLRLDDQCVTYAPTINFAGYDNYCLITCRDENGNTLCDTTFVSIAIQPASDEIYLSLQPGVTVETCLSTQVTMANVTAAACGGTGATFTVDDTNEKCLSITPDPGFTGTTRICVLHCSDGVSPLGPLCDTTYINMDVATPCADNIFHADTAQVNGLNGRTSLCLPVPLFQMQGYNIKIDGISYTGTFDACGVDSVYSYSYFALPGMGMTGPYRIENWMANGVAHSGTFDDMAAFVDTLNNWTPNGDWKIYPSLFTIVGRRGNNTFGKMKITQLDLNVTIELRADLAEFASGTSIQLNGSGWHLLTAENIAGACADIQYIHVNNEVTPTVTDTLYFLTEMNTELSGQCLPTDELPGILDVVTVCQSTQNGTLDVNGSACFDYVPDTDFTGTDLACVILCDDLGVCDTTIIVITVEPPQPDCEDIFNESVINLEADICDGTGTLCIAVPPAEYLNYELYVNGVIYNGSTSGCEADTLFLYNLAVLPGAAAAGPYRLDSWQINGDIFSSTFSGLSALADSLTQWDAYGNWTFDADAITLRGGDTRSSYGAMEITQISSGQKTSIGVERGILPRGTAIDLPLGVHELILIDTATNCSDTATVQLACPTINDTKISRSGELGVTGIFCLSDAGLPFDEDYIQSISNACTPGLLVDFEFDMADNCITYIGRGAGVDSICYNICLQNGNCFVLTLEVVVVAPCRDFITQEAVYTGVSCDQTDFEICINGFNISSIANYALEIEGEPYSEALKPCSFDSTFTFSYFSLPGEGLAGPYRVVSWTINGTVFSGEFQDITALVDSMNRWDVDGNWRHNPAGLAIIGGHPQNTYGTLEVEQIATGAPATMEANTTIVPEGIAVRLPDAGTYELVFYEINTGCRDTVLATARCVSTITLNDTIRANERGRICLPTDELAGAVVTIENTCSDNAGEIVLFNISNQNNCLTYDGVEPGQEHACIVLCDEFGICDTTILNITVLPPDTNEPLAARADTANTQKGSRVIINALGNDLYGPLSDFYILTQPANGAARFLPDGTIEYTPDINFCNAEEPDNFDYVICSAVGCDTAQVSVFVSCELVRIHNGFSPNGDGQNDFFIIEGIEKYPENRLEIFNRWGNLVYEADGYNNTWDGSWDSITLTQGTYYYILKDGNGKVYSGYVQIER